MASGLISVTACKVPLTSPILATYALNKKDVSHGYTGGLYHGGLAPQKRLTHINKINTGKLLFSKPI